MAAATFNDSPSCMGMPTSVSAALSSSCATPAPSLPMIQAQGWARSMA